MVSSMKGATMTRLNRAAILISLTVLVAMATPATALAESDSTEMTAAETVQLVGTQDPTHLTAQDLVVGTGELTSDQGEFEVSLPLEAAAPLTLGRTDGLARGIGPGGRDPDRRW